MHFLFLEKGTTTKAKRKRVLLIFRRKRPCKKMVSIIWRKMVTTGEINKIQMFAKTENTRFYCIPLLYYCLGSETEPCILFDARLRRYFVRFDLILYFKNHLNVSHKKCLSSRTIGIMVFLDEQNERTDALPSQMPLTTLFLPFERFKNALIILLASYTFIYVQNIHDHNYA